MRVYRHWLAILGVVTASVPGLALAQTGQGGSAAVSGGILLDAAQVQARVSAVASEPRRYAVAQPADADVSSGVWDLSAPGESRWMLHITSPGARSLSVHLSTLHLPASGHLWFRSIDGRDTQGPYSQDHGSAMTTPIVRGEEAIIEARMPSSERENFALQLTKVFHGFRSLQPDGVIAKGQFGTSGACNVDVVCSDGNDWRDEIRSTVLLTIDDIDLCTGTLVNNTLQNDRALVLTAAHCEITSANVDTVVAYFNTQRATCGPGPDGPVNQNPNGPVNQNIEADRLLASSVTNNRRADYALFELKNKPPSNFNAYYAGWDITDGIPTSGVGIHHPSGDDKKISTFTSPAQRGDGQCIGENQPGGGCDGFVVDAWAINWRRGTTEPGSSGSGLWDPGHRIVGTLAGGSAQCTTGTNSAGIDLYARLSVGWTATSTTGTTLKQALDSANSNRTTLDGKNPGESGPDGGGSGGGGGGVPLSLLLPFALAALWRRRCRG